MADVDRTKKEIEEHAAKADDHHTRYSDSEAVDATDGVIDADTVDNKHANELGATATDYIYMAATDGGTLERWNLGDGTITNLTGPTWALEDLHHAEDGHLYAAPSNDDIPYQYDIAADSWTYQWGPTLDYTFSFAITRGEI